jgi:hypothetical protein
MICRGATPVLAAILLATALSCADARSSRHAGSGYGLQGGVSPVLSQANVFSGIYGDGYPEDRARYPFNAPCPSPRQAVAGYVLTCPYGER